MIDRRQPGFADLLDLAAHADGINLRRRRQRADHDRDVVFAALGVGDVGEDEGAAFFLRHAADELPAHQRMQLGVLVDRGVDARDQAGGFEIGEMILEIEARPLPRRTRAASFVGLVEHAVSLRLIPRPYHTRRVAAKAPNPLMNSEPGTTTAAGGSHVRSGAFQGRPRCRSARCHQDIWLRHLGDVERTGTGSEPSAAIARSGAGAAWHGARPLGARQSAVAAREAGLSGAGDISRAEHLHHAVVVSDQATDRQSRADVELSRHSCLRHDQLLRRS